MQILRLYISPAHIYVGHPKDEPGESPLVETSQVECVAGQGLRGDRYCGWKDDYKGQITLFAFETYEWLSAELGIYDRDPGVFRRNVITKGVDLNELIGREFEVQGLRFFGTEEARPCFWMNSAFGEGAHELLNGRGGLRAKILSDGVLRVTE